MASQQFILSEVIEMTGGTRSLLQLWTSEGLLKPSADSTGAGRGSRRRFPLEEVELAALMVRMSLYGSTLRALRTFEKKFRARAFGTKFTSPSLPLLVQAARRGDRAVFAGFARRDENHAVVEIFRWDGTHPNLPEKLARSPDQLLINLVETWRAIPRQEIEHS